MNKLFQNFLLLLGILLLTNPWLAAQTCTVDVADIAGVTTASGSTTICANEAIFLPNVDFVPGTAQSDPGIIWGIYSQGNNNACQPSTTLPGADVCFSSLGYTILLDSNGEPIIGDGTADLTQSGLFAENQSSLVICLVPMISPDITPPPGQNIPFDNTCSGIDLNYDYPCFTILNPDLNPLLCSECPSLTFNDECDAAYPFDLLVPSSIENLPFDNNCATSGPNDPSEGTCFGVEPDNDPFTATVWFTFVGNGGTYTLNTQACAGSSNVPLTDTQIALFSGTCDNLSLVACNEQITGATNYAGISNFATTTGTTYYVLVDGYAVQNGEFCFDLIEIAPPLCLAQSGNPSLLQPNLCANTPFNISVVGSNTTADFNNLIVIVNDATGTIAATSTNGNNVNLPIGDYYIYNLNYEDGNTFNTAIGTAFSSLQNQVNAADCAALSEGLGVVVPFCLVCDAAISSVGVANGTSFCANASPSTGEISFVGTPDVPEYLNLVAITDNNFQVLDYTTNAANIDLSTYPAGSYHICGVDYYMNDADAVLGALDAGQLPSIASDICAAFACADISILPASSPDCISCNNSIDPIVLEGDTNLCGTTLSGNISVTGTPVTDDNVSQLIIYDETGNIISFAPVGAIDFATYGITSGCVNVTAINYALIDEADVWACNSISCLISAINNNEICAALAVLPTNFCILAPGDPACCTGSDIEEISVDGNITTLCGTTTTGDFFITGIPPTSTQIIRLVVFVIPESGNPEDATIVDITEVAPLDFNNYAPIVAQYGVAAISFAPEAEANILPCEGQPTACIFEQIAGGLICAEPTNNFLTFTLIPNGQGECCLASAAMVVVNGGLTTVCSGSQTDIISITGTPVEEGYESALIVDNTSVFPANSSVSFTTVGEHTVCGVNYFAADSLLVISNLLNGGDPIGCFSLTTDCLTFNVLPISDPACNPLNVLNINTQIAPDGLTYTVTFDIIGGTGTYVVDANQLPDSSYTSLSIPCGTSYSFNVTDSGNTATIIVDGIAPCQLPCPNPGSLPSFTGNVLICSGNSTDFTATGGQNYPNTIVQYVLASDANNVLGSIVATNNAATFSGSGLSTNTVYYIAAIAGYTNAAGNIDLTDACTTVSNLIPVVFLTPLGYEIDEDCDWMTGKYTVTIYPTGGFPAYDSDGTYTVSPFAGGLPETVQAGSVVTYILEDSDVPNHLYHYELTDGVCNAISVANDEPYVCTKTPIEWLSFRGEILPDGNLLKWATASENNSDYFAIERSVDGINYSKIASLKAAGNSTQNRYYTYTDKQVPAGQIYYRIVEYDFDGDMYRSNVISLSRSGDKLSFNKIYPVPARNSIDISFNATNYAAAQLQVYDVAGRLVDEQTLITRKGLNTHTLTISNYSKGVYFISIVTDNGAITTRFVKN